MSDVYVVAGTYAQYLLYAKNKTGDDKFYIYVNSPDTLRGILDPHGVFIGTWMNRPDADQIIDNLLVASRSQTTFNAGIMKAREQLTRQRNNR